VPNRRRRLRWPAIAGRVFIDDVDRPRAAPVDSTANAICCGVVCQFAIFHGDDLQGEPYSPSAGANETYFDLLGSLVVSKGFKFLLGIFRRNFARLHRRALPVITSTAHTVNAQGPAAPASHSPTPSALNFMAVPLAPYGAGIGRGGGGVGSDAGEGSLNRAREGARRARSPPAQLCAGADPKAWAGAPWRLAALSRR
jgi:hypothetical protein